MCPSKALFSPQQRCQETAGSSVHRDGNPHGANPQGCLSHRCNSLSFILPAAVCTIGPGRARALNPTSNASTKLTNPHSAPEKWRVLKNNTSKEAIQRPRRAKNKMTRGVWDCFLHSCCCMLCCCCHSDSFRPSPLPPFLLPFHLRSLPSFLALYASPLSSLLCTFHSFLLRFFLS